MLSLEATIFYLKLLGPPDGTREQDAIPSRMRRYCTTLKGDSLADLFLRWRSGKGEATQFFTSSELLVGGGLKCGVTGLIQFVKSKDASSPAGQSDKALSSEPNRAHFESRLPFY